MFGTSSVLGPVIGGFFAGQENIFGITGWRWVFLVNVPIAIAALIVVTRTLHLRHERRDHRIDYWGAVDPHRRPGPAAHRRGAGPRVGMGLGQRARSATAIGVLGLVAFFVIERRDGRRGLGSVAAVPDPHRRRVIDRLGVHRHGHVRRHRRAAAVPPDRQGRDADAGRPAAPAADPRDHVRLDPVRPADLAHRPLPAVPHHRGRSSSPRRASRFHYVAGRHPALEDADRRGLLRGRAGLQLPAADPRRAERGAPARHRRGHLVGDVHPPDRRDAGHRRVPLDPLLQGGGEHPRGVFGGSPGPGRSSPRCRTRRATRRPTPRSSRG